MPSTLPDRTVINPRNGPSNPPSAGVREPHNLPAARRIRYGRLASGGIVLVVLGAIVYYLAINPNMGWDVAFHYFASIDLIKGLLVTLELTAVSMLVGILLGAVLALMRLSSNPLVKALSGLYIGFFRGTPLLVQVIFWFNISLIIPEVSIGIPFGGPTFFTGDTNQLVSPMLAGLLALSLNEAAYMAEIVRAGILSVEPGQLEAARTIGLSRSSTVTRIVLPQAMRVIVPPTGNQLIGMLKTTSLVSVIAVPELLHSAEVIYANNYQTIPLLIAASIWYLIVSTILTYIQGHIERYYGRGTRTQTATFFQRLRARKGNRNSDGPLSSPNQELEPGIESEAR